MGRETRCMAEFDGWMGEGKLLLETDDLIFRGAARWSAPLKELKVEARDGWLEVRRGESSARFDLGKAAEKWAQSIANPRGLIDKLDVKPGAKVVVVGVDDAELLEKLRVRASEVRVLDEAADVAGTADVILYRADEPEALDALATLRSHIEQNGAIWVVSPKGRKEIADVVVTAAAKRAGLVVVKVARFSDTHTSLKLVSPKDQRKTPG